MTPYDVLGSPPIGFTIRGEHDGSLHVKDIDRPPIYDTRAEAMLRILQMLKDDRLQEAEDSLRGKLNTFQKLKQALDGLNGAIELGIGVWGPDEMTDDVLELRKALNIIDSKTNEVFRYVRDAFSKRDII
jgi:hypothetical protein